MESKEINTVSLGLPFTNSKLLETGSLETLDFTLLLGYFSGFSDFYLAWIFVYTWLFPGVEAVPWFVKLEILLYQWTITNSRPCKS